MNRRVALFAAQDGVVRVSQRQAFTGWDGRVAEEIGSEVVRAESGLGEGRRPLAPGLTNHVPKALRLGEFSVGGVKVG